MELIPMSEDNTERYEKLVDKDPTELHERFADWLVEKTGYEDIDQKSVQLACALRIDFQRSPENQELLAEKRTNAEKREQEREERREAREKKKLDGDKARGTGRESLGERVCQYV